MSTLSIAKAHLNIGHITFPTHVKIPLPTEEGICRGEFTFDLLTVTEVAMTTMAKSNLKGLKAFRDFIVDSGVTVLISYRIELSPKHVHSSCNVELQTTCSKTRLWLEEVLGFDVELVVSSQ